MHARHVVSGLTLTALLFLCACHDDQVTGTAPITNATVRFINATPTNIDIATNGTVEAGNGSIGYGASGVCTVVNAATPNLTIEQAGTTTAIGGFTPSFAPGGNYTVIAYPSASGTTQFATLDNTGFVPDKGKAGLRIFNAAPGAAKVDAFVGTSTTANVSGVAYGNGSAFSSVPTGNQTVTINNAGTTTALVTAPSQSFGSGLTSILIVAPPAAGSTTLRTFTVGGC